MIKRPRRNRKSTSVRSLVEETVLRPQDLVMPLFVMEGEKEKLAIPSMPGIFKFSKDQILKEAERLHRQGLPAVALFPICPKEKKDFSATEALNEKGLIPLTVRLLKKEIPSLCVITDVALDPYTSHGHDGLTNKHGVILNDETVGLLTQISLIHAACGADYVAPSDMMDGRVAAIRSMMDLHGFIDTGIISYTAKYASSLYGPFRDALSSHVAFGDKKTYHMNPANIREALLEASLDEEEGADALMVKPALFYLDVIAKIKQRSHLPICAYHVSGEYALIMAGAEKGIIDSDRAFLEALVSIKRAGADFIFSYASARVLELIL